MAEPFTLSVCIPTFNRADLLKGSLALLSAEWQGLSPARQQRLEVVICDNASSDGTPGVAEEFAALHESRVTYHRRAANIEGDNAYLCTERATGDFVWIVSDDDILLPGTLDRLFDVLDEEPPVDAVALNIRSFRDSPDQLGPLAFATWHGIERRDRDRMFTEVGTMLTFLSILMFRRSLVAETDYGFARGTNLIQAYAFTDAINRASQLATLADPVLAYRLGNLGSYDFARVFVDNFMDLLDYARRGGLGNAAHRCMTRHHFRRHLLSMTLNFKRHGPAGSLRPDWSGIRRRVLHHFGRDPLGATALVLVTTVPGPAVKRLEDLARPIRSRLRRSTSRAGSPGPGDGC